MDEVAGRKAVACLAAVWLLVAAAPGDSQPVADRPGLEDLADRAVAAANAGQLAEALKLYRELEQSADSSLSWAGVSGQVIVHRMAGDGASARLVTQRVGAERPELAGLMAVWDGDTAMVEKDVERALGEYRRAADIHGTQVVDGRPVGVTALRQLSRAHLEKRDASAAAEAERELARRFPRFVDREEAAGRILAFEAMAAGELPLKPMARLLEDGDCSPKRPCVFGRGGVVQHGSPPADAKPLAGQQGLFVTADAEAAAGFDDGPNVPAEAPPASTALACTTTTAYSGFVNPMNGVKGGGFAFMETPDCCGGWHTGIDLNRGGFQQDCDDPFYSAAEGCVMDVMSSTSDWGSAAIEHFYPPSLWTSQYGHAHEVYVSVGQWVRRGKLIGRVGDTGTGACHLHFEIREPDHTTRNDAGSYHNASQSMVGDEYQDPLPFIAAHKRYTSVMPRDEDTFSFTPAASWTLVTTAGDNDDMRWALTTPASPKTTYARHTVTAPSGGTWELWAFIPYANRSSTAVPYTLTRLSDGVQMFRATINQSDKKDAWVRVGSAALTAGVQYRIEVATNTGETGRRVAVDDFLLIKPDLAARANLAVSGITFTRTPANGIRTTAIASLANTGSVASGTFNVKWFVDDLDDGLPPVLTGYGGHESLAPGQVSSGNVRFDWTPTASSAVACPNGPSGTYCTHALEFYADVDGHVIETDELNNVFRLELRVRNPADLKVSGITFTSPPKFGARTTAVAQLSNVGGDGVRRVRREVVPRRRPGGLRRPHLARPGGGLERQRPLRLDARRRPAHAAVRGRRERPGGRVEREQQQRQRQREHNGSGPEGGEHHSLSVAAPGGRPHYRHRLSGQPGHGRLGDVQREVVPRRGAEGLRGPRLPRPRRGLGGQRPLLVDAHRGPAHAEVRGRRRPLGPGIERAEQHRADDRERRDPPRSRGHRHRLQRLDPGRGSAHYGDGHPLQYRWHELRGLQLQVVPGRRPGGLFLADGGGRGDGVSRDPVDPAGDGNLLLEIRG